MFAAADHGCRSLIVSRLVELVLTSFRGLWRCGIRAAIDCLRDFVCGSRAW